MKYLPILEELFSSDSIIFMLTGMVITIVIGMMMKNKKKNIVGLGICFVIYVISEIVSNIRSSYLVEFVFLFIGTLAIGGVAGFLISIIVKKGKHA